MMKFGFIGFGSMAKMLINVLVNWGIAQDQVIVTRKDKNRLKEVNEFWPGIHIAETATEVAEKSQCIFLCIKPLEYKSILEEIKPCINEQKQLISITGAVTLKEIENIVDCKITKIIPTIISEVKEGITLISHNDKVSETDAGIIEDILNSVGKIKRVNEKEFGFATLLTSCGPGLLSAIIDQFVQTALRHNAAFKKEDIQEMVLQTLYGTTKLIIDKHIAPEEVIARVATKGGITEEGVSVINSCIMPVFDEMFNKAESKQKEVHVKIASLFTKS